MKELIFYQAPFHIWGLEDNVKIAAGDNISVICAVSVYNHTSDLNWYLNNNLIESEDSMTDFVFLQQRIHNKFLNTIFRSDRRAI